MRWAIERFRGRGCWLGSKRYLEPAVAGRTPALPLVAEELRLCTAARSILAAFDPAVE